VHDYYTIRLWNLGGVYSDTTQLNLTQLNSTARLWRHKQKPDWLASHWLADWLYAVQLGQLSWVQLSCVAINGPLNMKLSLILGAPSRMMCSSRKDVAEIFNLRENNVHILLTYWWLRFIQERLKEMRCARNRRNGVGVGVGGQWEGEGRDRIWRTIERPGCDRRRWSFGLLSDMLRSRVRGQWSTVTGTAAGSIEIYIDTNSKILCRVMSPEFHAWRHHLLRRWILWRLRGSLDCFGCLTLTGLFLS